MSLAGYKLDEDLVLIAQIMALPFVETLWLPTSTCISLSFYLEHSGSLPNSRR